MTLVLGFAPFILFTLLSRLSADLALWTAFAAAFVVTIRDFIEKPQLRLLDCTSLLLFAFLALWRGFFDPGLTLAALRSIVDLGFLAAIAISLLRRQPFSLQYADGQGWNPQSFSRVNYVISGTWAAAFAVMAVTDAAVILAQDQPLYVGIAVSVAVIGFSIAVTLRYPATVQR